MSEWKLIETGRYLTGKVLYKEIITNSDVQKAEEILKVGVYRDFQHIFNNNRTNIVLVRQMGDKNKVQFKDRYGGFSEEHLTLLNKLYN